ncbi:MAG TPA: mechanosensitive ion channel family protein, partial [Pseudogracilibacillus sp.]|nr:mechanosensitive ion channel family protein [Pseudogracilibacillus sp.]
KIKIDDILIPFLSRALQFITIIIGASIVLQEFDYHIGGLITGLGIGGLAISLAAKDALANLFGGVVIVTEKPFTINDWIMTPSVEGTVEDISFRSTKVRTFDQALVVVPNATLSNEAITNWSKMGKRRISFDLRLTYTTPKATIEDLKNKIEQALREHPGVHEETILVIVNEFQDYGIDLMIYFFTKSTDWDKNLQVREEVNLQILELLEETEAQIAIPSRKLYVKNHDEDDEVRDKEE